MQDIFKAIADPTRRENISILIQQDLTVKEVNQRINIPDSTLSHHLEILYGVDWYLKEELKLCYYLGLPENKVDFLSF